MGWYAQPYSKPPGGPFSQIIGKLIHSNQSKFILTVIGITGDEKRLVAGAEDGW
jgi:hypothetical protein